MKFSLNNFLLISTTSMSTTWLASAFKTSNILFHRTGIQSSAFRGNHHHAFSSLISTNQRTHATTFLPLIYQQQSHRKHGSSTSLSNATQEQTELKSIEEKWNITELKKETARLTLRCLKKVGKTKTRLDKVQEEVEELRSNPDATQKQLEACPNVGQVEQDLEDLRTRLKKLNSLEELLVTIKGKNTVLPENVYNIVQELEVNDKPPQRAPRGPGKKKGPRTEAPRLPYYRYYTKNNTEIRVGRRSEDNDELSCNPNHRDGADWWMHASGCPGSHVVIRCHDNSLENDVIMDAAALAARQSKCTGAVIKVSLTRCRDVKKPPGAKPGLVQLTGKVRSISVNMKKEESRLNRIDTTMVGNG